MAGEEREDGAERRKGKGSGKEMWEIFPGWKAASGSQSVTSWKGGRD